MNAASALRGGRKGAKPRRAHVGIGLAHRPPANAEGREGVPMKRETPARDEETVPGYRQPAKERTSPEDGILQEPMPVPLTGPPWPEIGPIPSER
jgi:hypothetical protein